MDSFKSAIPLDEILKALRNLKLLEVFGHPASLTHEGLLPSVIQPNFAVRIYNTYTNISLDGFQKIVEVGF